MAVIHIRSIRGEFAVCGASRSSSVLPLTWSKDEATCKNCIKIKRAADRINRAEQLARDWPKD